MTTLSSNNQWELFGFDLRQASGLFSRVWHDVIWAYHCPVRQKLDSAVEVYRWQDAHPTKLLVNSTNYQAVMLPDSHVLIRRLWLPRAALGHLSQVVNVEVAAASPFLADDTVVGQRVDDAGGAAVELTLAIASRSGVMGLLRDANPDITVDTYEIWAESEGKTLVLEGFAEPQRNANYRKRLALVSAYCVIATVSLLSLMALPWLYQSYRFNKVESLLEQSRFEARTAMRRRTELTENNARIDALQAEVNSAASPLIPLAILTRSLEDDAWLGEYKQGDDTLTIDGYANDAATLIQRLTAIANFHGVKPLSAIRKVGENDIERFRLELQLSGRSGEQP
ncbi:PilN domain-containing protein [uncultured Gilvimarinus sp.]|uniref:PilN domain-containing protein n=1 Tax=uncultured Gilvimarinus sp. TaxID=1689143 RepID=UPI0030D844C1